EVKRENGKWPETPRVIWQTPNQFKLKFNDAVYRDGHVYGLDEGILSCVEFDTGKRVWKRGRYGFGQLLLIDDRLLILSEDGAVALVEASPKSRGKELARFQAIEGVTWNHPVIAHGHLYVRNAEEAACYDLRPTRTTAAK
ncbi:MAG: PQQ-binding-like beta-propeller repeat protein, partial [Planctomycetaceae bacterium]